MAKRVKREIWMNEKYLETVRNQETAEMKIRSYMRQDRYEIEVEGYKNSLPTYEIR